MGVDLDSPASSPLPSRQQSPLPSRQQSLPPTPFTKGSNGLYGGHHNGQNSGQNSVYSGQNSAQNNGYSGQNAGLNGHGNVLHQPKFVSAQTFQEDDVNNIVLKD